MVLDLGHQAIRPSFPSLKVAAENSAVAGQDGLDLSDSFDSSEVIPEGPRDFFGSGLIKGVMKWTSREVPSRQSPMSEEEKQQILEKIQPGDVILTYAGQRPNLGHLGYWTTGAHYTHCALYEGYGQIIETLGDEVRRSPLVDRLEGPLKVAVVRPPYKDPGDAKLVVKAAKGLLGTPYDYNFDNKDAKELYCSELIEVAMKKVDPDLQVPDASFMGREITAPDGFLEMEGARLVHDGESHYWANQLQQWPLYLGAALGAGLGAALGWPLGAVAGTVLGYEAVHTLDI